VRSFRGRRPGDRLQLARPRSSSRSDAFGPGGRRLASEVPYPIRSTRVRSSMTRPWRSTPRGGDYSRWVREVLADRRLGGELAVFEPRWRPARAPRRPTCAGGLPSAALRHDGELRTSCPEPGRRRPSEDAPPLCRSTKPGEIPALAITGTETVWQARCNLVTHEELCPWLADRRHGRLVAQGRHPGANRRQDRGHGLGHGDRSR